MNGDSKPDCVARDDCELHIFTAEAHFGASVIVVKQTVRGVDESCYGQLVLHVRHVPVAPLVLPEGTSLNEETLAPRRPGMRHDLESCEV